MKILFILKKREHFDKDKKLYGGLSSGLYNSVNFVHNMKIEGVESKIVIVNDNNYIDTEVNIYKPNYVIIEALWVVPEKFEVLTKLHPTVKWIIRLHSELPFLAGEGIAMDWIYKCSLYSNVSIACNSPRMVDEMKFFTGKNVVYLPNYYPPHNFKLKNHTYINNNTLEIGCFGAIRPMKNHLIQALAAIEFSKSIGKKLNFHINSDRLEMNGEPGLKNLVGLFERFKSEGHTLVCHSWFQHEEFLKICAKMDFGMQVSFSETFNIVSADLISQGIPIISTQELPWIIESATCDPTSSKDIIKKLKMMYKNPTYNVVKNQESLKTYVNKTQSIWSEYFTGVCDEDNFDFFLNHCQIY